jgi:spore germination protein GerM
MIHYKQLNPRYFNLRAITALLIIYSLCSFYQNGHAEPIKTSREKTQLNTSMPTPSKKSPVHLYFIAKSNYFLMSERRAVIHPDGTVNFARAIIEALIKGPQEGLLRTIPSGTKLKAVFVTPDGVCYVDLSEEIRHNHPGGSNTELLTVYSIVNSLILNVPEIRRVKLLIDGSEVLTLAGHINLQFPVKANMLLIR